MVEWSRLRDKLRKGEWYAFSAVCLIAGVVAGREITLLAKPEPVFALTAVGAVLLAYWLALLTATIIAEIKERRKEAPKTI